MIGAKTISSITLLIVGVVIALAAGVLDLDHLARQEPRTTFWVVLFAVVFGTAVYRYWRVGTPSANYFRLAAFGSEWEGESHFLGTRRLRLLIGENPGDAFELQPRFHHLIYMALAFLIGLATLDARALAVLASLSEQAQKPSGQVCPDLEAEAAEPTVDDDAPGCALIRRAFELGYAKSLGDCGKKKTAGPLAVCHLRQYDEPFAHFAFRLLHGFVAGVREVADPAQLVRTREALEHKVDRLETLLTAQHQVLTVAPRSSHHVFTNLPRPDHGFFADHRCLERLRILPHRPPDGDPALWRSRVFEHVVAKLLFETRYMPAAAFCPEVIIHWAVPADACARLADDASALLASEGALEHVLAALGRKAHAAEIDALHARLVELGVPPIEHETMRELSPQKFASFSCYIEDDGLAAASAHEHPLQLRGQSFVARELRVPPLAQDPHGLYVDRYETVAELLAPGFRYDTLSSSSTIDPRLEPSAAIARTFSAGDFALARLDVLRGADVFVHPGAVTRADLLEVYPYFVHMQSFVRTFRRHYARERGRL